MGYLSFWHGLALGGSLIIAIGAQNAFVLRQGLRREHLLPVVLICSFSDALLILLGIAGMGALVRQSPLLLQIVTFGGAVFLIWYGLRSLRNAARDEALRAGGVDGVSLGAAAGTILALTYLNPHVYLDTVVLVGGIGGQYPDGQRELFAAGAIAASFLWFFGLGFGARLVAPLLARPVAWRVLDVLIGVTMFWLASGLVMTGVERMA